jgi:Flp pilus assembly pilin Flp
MEKHAPRSNECLVVTINDRDKTGQLFNEQLLRGLWPSESTNVPLLLLFYPDEYWEEINPINPKARTWTLPVDSLLALWRKDEAQDIAEYAVMLAVILVLIIATIRLIGANSNNAFSSVSSSLQ